MSNVNCYNHVHFVNRFLCTKEYHTLVIRKSPASDELFEELLDIANQHEVYISTQYDFNLTHFHSTLSIFQEPTIEEYSNTLNQKGIQFELLRNTWLILSNVTFDKVKDYFSGIKFRMGLNANVFFALKSEGTIHLVQVTGTGTINVELMVSTFRYKNWIHLVHLKIFRNMGN